MLDSFKFYISEEIKIDDILKKLDDLGYTRCRKVAVEGDYSLIGDILTVYPVTFEYPVRVDIFEDRIASIKSVDVATFKAISEHNGVIILPVSTLR
ncbi:MAG TPA: hypothetical protein PKG81_05640, partial [Candidatus Omnitrophota bacterium]|nr:hypothetical protein [Candidatus Omnitrophota bacterium]